MNPLRAAQRYYAMRSSWLGDGGQPVPVAVAFKRAAVCNVCPKNNPDRPLWKFLAEVGSWELRRQVQLKQELALVTPFDSNLHVCDGCGCLLPLKVWVPLAHIRDTTPLADLQRIDDQFDGCWILAELTS